ncbi:MAG: DUF1015 domain-containing protein [Deltaproteobacteria bacterium]|nr:DUF1015 domain-containing protein [Deltaproteobacteria bacterium]
MADVRPFRACRYATTDSALLARLLTPPYDIISPSEQRALHDSHPNNFVRLELGYTRDDDTESDNRYTRSAKTMRSWFEKGTLIEDATPALYVYDQSFQDPWGARRTRRSVVAAVRLVPFEERVVLPHERTLSAPKEDRFRLISALGAQTSPVFGLYEDPANTVLSALDFSKKLVSRATTPDGITHALARVDARETIRAVAGFLKSRQILIADGHHRYETALRYAASVSARSVKNPNAASNFTLFALTPLSDRGLVILPTHRLLRDVDLGPNPDETIRGKLRGAGFDATPLASAAECEAELAKINDDRVAFAVVHHRAKSAFIATRPVPTDATRNETALDVVALHEDLLTRGFGLSAESQARQENLSYVKSAAEAVAAVADGRATFAVILRSTPLNDLFRVTSRGVRLPQKSTYFVPKIVSGLFFRRIEPLETIEDP